MWCDISKRIWNVAIYTACRNMPERDGKDQGEGIPKQAFSYWFAWSSWLATVARTMRYYVSMALSVSHRCFLSLILLVFVAPYWYAAAKFVFPEYIWYSDRTTTVVYRVFPDEFSYLLTTSWVVEISKCDNSINIIFYSADIYVQGKLYIVRTFR